MDVGDWMLVVTLVGALASVLMTLVMMLLPIGVMVLVFRVAAHGSPNERALLANGLSAPATITGAIPTRSHVVHLQGFHISLSVALPDGSVRATWVRKFLSLDKLPLIQPGRIVEVRYDPANPSRVAITGL